MWRSIVWAARKPFVLQLLPPLVTMRVDDESGPFEWLHAAVDAGFKPWVGVFLSHIDDRESRDLASIVRGGNATVSVHAFDDPTFFYFDHNGRRDWPAATMAANWRRAIEWHERYDLPISRYVAPHWYEIGANALPLIAGSGVRFVATLMTPGGPYGMPWLRGRPFRLERPGISNSPAPVYYADFLSGEAGSSAAGLFNCVTEIRDDAGYEWYPSPHVDTTVGRGVRQLSRALDSRALATLFTHGYFFPPIPAADWRRILDLTLAGIAAYEPIQMTMEEACGFVRDQQTSALTAVPDQGTGAVHATVAGRAEGPTTLSVFVGSGPTIDEHRVVVPAFDGSIDVTAETPSPRTEPR